MEIKFFGIDGICTLKKDKSKKWIVPLSYKSIRTKFRYQKKMRENGNKSFKIKIYSDQ